MALNQMREKHLKQIFCWFYENVHRWRLLRNLLNLQIYSRRHSSNGFRIFLKSKIKNLVLLLKQNIKTRMYIVKKKKNATALLDDKFQQFLPTICTSIIIGGGGGGRGGPGGGVIFCKIG